MVQNKSKKGVIYGIIAGVIDLIPMILQNLTWDANVSAFLFWVISGYVISSSNLKIKGYQKGIFLSFLVLSPSAVLIGWHEPVVLIPIVIMTVILGGALGFFIEKE